MSESKQLIKDNIWGDRIPAANRQYEEWESRFKCNILEKYYEGEQWRSQENMGYNPYVINKFFETIQIKIAQFIPTFPRFEVSSVVTDETDLETAGRDAHLKEDVLNTAIQDPNNNFAEEAEQTYKDHFFRFGILEVGYSADWFLNPNAPKPLLGKDTDSNLSVKKRQRVVEQPTELPRNERVFFKHIPAKTFRVGGLDHKYLSRCGWCGYFEWVNPDELLSIPKLKNRDKIEIAFNSRHYEPRVENTKFDASAPPRGARKVWHLWDLKGHKRLVVLDTPFVTIYEKSFKRLPLFDLRPDKRLITNGFYPIPPAYHWLSPQDEYNETREMLRAHRRRFIRKFQVIEGTCDDEEIEKFETGPDGGIIKVKKENAITAIDSPSLGPELKDSIATSADDLNRISGTSDESRGVADNTTATQANIVNQRTGLRESKDRDRVAKWASGAGREVILIVKDRFTGKMRIKRSPSAQDHFLGVANPHTTIYQEITSDDLSDEFDFTVYVDFTSMSPMAIQQEKQKFLEFLSILTQYPMIAFSPALVREAALKTGYRNEKAISEFQQMALLQELGRMNQLKAQANPAPAPTPGNAGQGIVAQQTPPQGEEIRNQLQNQLGRTQ